MFGKVNLDNNICMWMTRGQASENGNSAAPFYSILKSAAGYHEIAKESKYVKEIRFSRSICADKKSP